MPRKRNPTSPPAEVDAAAEPRQPNKLQRLEALLRRPDGASLAEIMADTGWQAHSVRGALAGAMKKRGHTVTSEKVDGVRRYNLSAA
jgi:hypothetical protein